MSELAGKFLQALQITGQDLFDEFVRSLKEEDYDFVDGLEKLRIECTSHDHINVAERPFGSKDGGVRGSCHTTSLDGRPKKRGWRPFFGLQKPASMRN
mmetsp:Transcript_1942/g.3506  ORF Transcript_1942/g.3506 Transcript_1942/m.3506 type:complete len:98 (-) Transcript_1942:265-558(-)